MKRKLKKFNIHNSNWQKLALELFVVFLGVTAGFILNGWREQRQEQVLEQKYLTRFLNDVRQNIKDLEEFVSVDSTWIAHAEPILNLFKNNDIVQDSAISAMKMMTTLSGVDLNTGTYEDMINSGNLNLIGDFQLRTELSNYNISLKKIKIVEDYSYQYFYNFVLPFIMSNFRLIDGEFTDPGIYKTTRFTNLFFAYYSMVQQKYKIYQEELRKSRLLEKQLLKAIKE